MTNTRNIFHMHNVNTFFSNLLYPHWRAVFIMIGTRILFESVRVVAPGQGGLLPYQGILGISYSVISFTLFWIASRPYMPAWFIIIWDRLPNIFHWRIWYFAIIMSTFMIIWRTMPLEFPRAISGNYGNDAIAFVHADAEALLHGHNPFTDNQEFWNAVKRWPNALATPILGSQDFGSNPFHYPSFTTMQRLLQNQYLNPILRNNDFNILTIHNYPAGIILLAIPLVWAGIPSFVWLNIFFCIAIIAIVIWEAPSAARWGLAIVLALNPSLLFYELLVNVDIPSLFFVLLAWKYMQRQRTSAILMGLACAIKQIAWFFAPFYIIEVYRRYGMRAAIERSILMAAAFLLPNLPFIIKSPAAWFQSILIPMTDHMFPLGFGPITLAMSHIIPFGSPHIWTLLVIGVWVALLIIQWKRPAITSDGLIFAVVPLWFSYRSPMNYFALLPLFVAWLAYTQRQRIEIPSLDEILEESSLKPVIAEVYEAELINVD